MAKNKSISRNVLKRCGLCGKVKNLTETDCCGNPICDDESNYALFPTRETVVTATTGITPFAPITTTKITRETGKTAKSAGAHLRPKYMCGMERTSTTSISCQTLPRTSRPAVPGAGGSSNSAQTAIVSAATSIGAKGVLPRRWRGGFVRGDDL